MSETYGIFVQLLSFDDCPCFICSGKGAWQFRGSLHY